MKYPLFKVHIDTKNALSEIEKVLNSGYIAEGYESALLEEKINEFLGIKNGVLVNSCTSALSLALILAGLKEDDNVITTSQTCVATSQSITFLGGQILWADINPNTGMIDPDSVERLLEEKRLWDENEKNNGDMWTGIYPIKAVICVSWAGIPPQLERLNQVCKKYNVPLILDAAHAFGAKIKGKCISEYADFTCFSFQAIKHFTTSDGGMIVCKDEKLVNEAKKLRWFGIDRTTTKDKFGNWKSQAWNVDIDNKRGFKFHLNNYCAALGLSNLPHIRDILDKHIRNGELFNKIFKAESHGLINNIPVEPGHEPVYWINTILLDNSINRAKVLEVLHAEEIGAAFVHEPNHYYSCFKNYYKDLPNVDYFSSHQISLPCGWWLEKEDVEFIARKTIELCKKNIRLSV